MSPGRRIVIASNFYPPDTQGGAEIVAHRHAKLLRTLGWDVKVLAGEVRSEGHRPGSLRVDYLDGIEVSRLSLTSLEPSDNFRNPLANNLLKALIAGFQPEWLWAHNLIGLGADLIDVARSADVKVAVTLHDNWGHCFRGTRLRPDMSVCRDPDECHLCAATMRAGRAAVPTRLRRDFIMRRLDQTSLCISPSSDMAEKYVGAGLDGDRLIVQSNGIDLQSVEFRIRRPGPKVNFLCAAYLGEHKGIPVLLKALESLDNISALDGRWSMTFAGHGQLDKRVQRAITDHGWQNRVEFVGRLERAELLERLAKSDVVVLPSVWPENEPVILLEAIASGAALIATGLGGNPELLGFGRSGILVEPGDADDLARAMRRLIEQPESLSQFSQTNGALRKSFDEGESVGRIVKHMSRQTGSNTRRRNPVILCGGDLNVATTVLVSALPKMAPGVKPYLIWSDWARPGEWEDAVAYWHFDPNDDLSAVSAPLKRSLPIIVAGGSLAANLTYNDAAFLRYDSASEFVDIIERFGDPTPLHSTTPPSLYRDSLQLRAAETFRWTVATQ